MKKNSKNFNSYVIKEKFDDKTSILYNSFNRAVVLIENDKLNEIAQNIEYYDQLEKLGFFKSDKEIINLYKTKCEKKPSELRVIIKMCETCNFKCKYCYQSNWVKSKIIQNDIIDNILLYIERKLKNHHFNMLIIEYFGGEPLLAQNQIIYIHNYLTKLCKNERVVLKEGITTNGYLLNEDFVKKFEDLSLHITLSLKEDHDAKRILANGNKTFQKIWA